MPRPVRELLAVLSDSSERNFEETNVILPYDDYLSLIPRHGNVAQNAFKRMYNMLNHFGTRKILIGDVEVVRYKLFDDPFDAGANAVYGIDINIENIVAFFRSAAENSSLSHRILILHGPKGSAKSTIVNLLKKGLEEFSKHENGEFYTLDWGERGKFLGFEGSEDTAQTKYNLNVCPMNEEPLHLLARMLKDHPNGDRLREEYEHALGISIEGDLCPFCNERYNIVRDRCRGNIEKVLDAVRVRKLQISRNNRVGIGVIDSMMEEDVQGLVGYAIDTIKETSTPYRNRGKEFFLDGEMNVANRGLLEVKEIFRGVSKYGLSQKLKRLMSASQEHVIKPGNCPETEIDEVLIGHTNPLQFDILLSLEDDAFISRLITFDIPHLLIAGEEAKIYQKEFNNRVYPGIHFSPHLFDVMAGFAVMTRLTDDLIEKNDQDQRLRVVKGRRNSIEIKKEYEAKRYDARSIFEKYRCYNGDIMRVGDKPIDVVHTMMQSARNGEGLGIGFDPRYFQNLLSFIIMDDTASIFHRNAPNSGKTPPNGNPYEKCVTPLLVQESIRLNIREDKGIAPNKLDNYLTFLELLNEVLRQFIVDDVESSMGLGLNERKAVLDRYLREISKLVRKETQKDRFSMEDKAADLELLEKIESYLPRKPSDYRSQVLSVMTDLSPDLAKLLDAERLPFILEKFRQKKPELLVAIRDYLEDFNGEQVRSLRRAMQQLVEFGKVATEGEEAFSRFRSGLIEHYGYCEHCVDIAIAYYARLEVSKQGELQYGRM